MGRADKSILEQVIPHRSLDHPGLIQIDIIKGKPGAEIVMDTGIELFATPDIFRIDDNGLFADDRIGKGEPDAEILFISEFLSAGQHQPVRRDINQASCQLIGIIVENSQIVGRAAPFVVSSFLHKRTSIIIYMQIRSFGPGGGGSRANKVANVGPFNDGKIYLFYRFSVKF
jgi:hypothetical protein